MNDHLQSGSELPRRGFLGRFAAVVVGAIAGLVPAGVGLFVISSPARRKGSAGEVPYTKVTSVDSVPADGVPRVFRVIMDKQDAWTRHHQIPVGAVYLLRRAAELDSVIAFNTVCPHLGCFVDALPDRSFLCPCHNSQFKPDGNRGEPCVSPRGLDTLNARIEGDSILVEFMNFETSSVEKIPKV